MMALCCVDTSPPRSAMRLLRHSSRALPTAVRLSITRLPSWYRVFLSVESPCARLRPVVGLALLNSCPPLGSINADFVALFAPTTCPQDIFVFTLDRKSTRLNSSHLGISYAVFCF